MRLPKRPGSRPRRRGRGRCPVCWATHGREPERDTTPPAGGAAGPRLRTEGDLDEGSGGLALQLLGSFKVAGRSFRTAATIPPCATREVGALGAVVIAMHLLAGVL